MLAETVSAQTAPARLVVVDPGHFHATLVQKDMYKWLSPRVQVYSPLTPALIDYLGRIAGFNSRAENPTRWELDVHTGPDFFERMLADKAGDVVIFAGSNRPKIGRILKSLDAGMAVLADKPWIINAADMGKLETALNLAEQKNLAAYDIMTERFEITGILQRELVNTPGVFGGLAKGTAAAPAVKASSVHNVWKMVAGVPIKRPVSFFDIREQGEALADVGTHVVDQVQWILFPNQVMDYRTAVKMVNARHWATVIDKPQFQQVTGAADFPAQLAPWVKDGKLNYLGNNSVHYTVNGVHVEMEILWSWAAAGGSGDIYEASYQGQRARVEIRQGAPEKFRPEVYVVPATAADRAPVFAALKERLAALQAAWPGVAADVRETEAKIVIPDKFRVGHEAHFAQVTNLFAAYYANAKSTPAWEKSNMLLKYYVTTKGVELAEGK
jgi:predicted dehydrogenase